MRHLEAGRAEIDLKPSTNGNNGLFCTVERTNADNPVRNIRVSSDRACLLGDHCRERLTSW
jgi:hypothetical protein